MSDVKLTEPELGRSAAPVVNVSDHGSAMQASYTLVQYLF